MSGGSAQPADARILLKRALVAVAVIGLTWSMVSWRATDSETIETIGATVRTSEVDQPSTSGQPSSPTAQGSDPLPAPPRLTTDEIAALFTPVPTPEEARSACTAAHDGDHMDMGDRVGPGRGGVTPVVKQAADGYWERWSGSGPGAFIEVLPVPFDSVPTPAQEQAAAAFAAEVRQSALSHGWHDPAQAVLDGYRPMIPCDTHFVHLEHARDDRVLDPDRPEYLLLEQRSDGTTAVTGVMFMADGLDRGPNPFGPVAPWHYHLQKSCTVDNLEVPMAGQGCPPGSTEADRTAEMIHVSFEDPAYPGTM